MSFPTNEEAENMILLPLSYKFYADDPNGYNKVLTDFIGLLIKSMTDDKKESYTTQELIEMQERFKGLIK